MKTSTIIAIVVIALLAVLLFGGAAMMLGFGGGGMMGSGLARGMIGGYGWNPLWGIVSLVSRALLIAGVVLLAIWFIRSASSGSAHETPLDILKTRYAKGEITKEQFEQMKQDLGT